MLFTSKAILEKKNLHLSFCFFFLFWLHSRHMEVFRPGIEPMPQQRPEPLQWQCQSLSPVCHKRRPVPFAFILHVTLYLKTRCFACCAESYWILQNSENMLVNGQQWVVSTLNDFSLKTVLVDLHSSWNSFFFFFFFGDACDIQKFPGQGLNSCYNVIQSQSGDKIESLTS